jgi:hypothetical protein
LVAKYIDLFSDMGAYVTFDVVFGSLYAAIAVIEAYGIFAVSKVRDLFYGLG